MDQQGNVGAVVRSQSIHLNTDVTDVRNNSEETELPNSVLSLSLTMGDIVELLQAQFAIITGGKSKEGCPLITFPDNTNFHLLSDTEYQQLMLFLTSVPSLQEADLGFHLIVDRRKDRWNSIKTVLLKISVYFPGLVHVVYVIRPSSFLQKALSEVSNKLFKEEFKFRVIILSSVEELHEYMDIDQLTSDLGGTLLYSHDEWIQQRIALEQFSNITQRVSHALDDFTKTINETEFPNNVEATQQLLNQQASIYSELKEEILAAAKHGETLLMSIRENSARKTDSPCSNYPDITGNVFVVERLLVQLEETERTFDEFWKEHSTKLRHCLELRRFEQDFRELQVNFNSHFKTVSEMTEVGDTISRVETLIKETASFQKLCSTDIERAEEVISSGEQLLKIRNSFPHECIEPKCSELMRIHDDLLEKLARRMDTLVKCKNLMEQIEKIESPEENVSFETTELNNQNSTEEIDLTQYEVRKANRGHVLNELLETERIYVAELYSILKGYKMEAEAEANQPFIPPGLINKLDILFGNLDELYHFHADIFLKDLENCISATDLVALCFVQRRDMFYQLYSCYCQNIPRSEQLRETLVDSNMFFQMCQRKLGHKLPLAAYLLKPVQRITKYQLLLKDLLRHSDETKCCKELQQALDCMLVVLRCVNDSMHQISITGFPIDLSQQGNLLLQGSFSVWSENKKDLKLRIKPMQRHIFLYQKAVLFCKPSSKAAHNKSVYNFKHYLKMSQIGLTESVKGDIRKFELWLQGRQEVHTIQANTLEQKQIWVNEIKRVLLNQLEELKGEKIKQYSSRSHTTLRQSTSWEKEKTVIPQLNNHRTMSYDSETHSLTLDQEPSETIDCCNWSSDCSNSEDEEQQNNADALVSLANPECPKDEAP
ncbi:hypothetical protein ILUMI_02685 [Ignelater luminosus]|uniref:Guanine nucleotide exchange factor DBS n=1 Tax=Ignelater luminosus TaxID=2038154 RepID=A0A8K0GG84_IGNLU|nr:hypothetical protein ILUMI_02685 [Ignelater luminosus]